MDQVPGVLPASASQCFGYIDTAKNGTVIPTSGLWDGLKDRLRLGERRISGKRGARHYFTVPVWVYSSYSDVPSDAERVWLVRGIGTPGTVPLAFPGSPLTYSVIETVREVSEDAAHPSELETRGRQIEDVPVSRLRWRSVDIDALRRVKYAITILRGALLGLTVWSLNVDDELRQHLSRVYEAFNGYEIETDGEWVRRSAETILWAPFVMCCAVVLALMWLLRKRCRLLLTAQPSDEPAIRADFAMETFVTAAVGVLVNAVYMPNNQVWKSYWSPVLLIGVGAVVAFCYSWVSVHWGYQAPVKPVRCGGIVANADSDQ